MSYSWYRTRGTSYDPVIKIRSLLQDLDAELVQLCMKCSVRKPLVSGKFGTASVTGSLAKTKSSHTHKGSVFKGLTSQQLKRAVSTTSSTKLAKKQPAPKQPAPKQPAPKQSAPKQPSPVQPAPKLPAPKQAAQKQSAPKILAPVLPASKQSAPKLLAKKQVTPSTSIRLLRINYQKRVLEAYRNRKLFTIHGNYYTVRKSLLERGWLEKLTPTRYPNLQTLTEEALLENAKSGNEFETVLLSKMISRYPAYFVWQYKTQSDLFAEAKPYRNRIRCNALLDFTTKIGLIGCAEQETWHAENGVCVMSYPRFYRLDDQEDRHVFKDDYYNTQACSLLRWIKEHKPEELINSQKGAVSSNTLEFALNKVKKLARRLEHGLLDEEEATLAEEIDDQTFLSESEKVLKKGAKFKLDTREMIDYMSLASTCLKQIEALRPDFRWDGYRNLWILKPGYQSRGIGIVIRSTLDGILEWKTKNGIRKYIVQKYIERPLLIYRTKFDIRQYMLMTVGVDKVTIWTYRDCYLRFSSQEFTMDDLRESIHLTNNSVQKRYKNKPTRDDRLPKNNMWPLERFKGHLRYIGAPANTWAKIYNGFKQNIVAVVRASLDGTELVKNSFELYGCDFMLDEHYNPILIEINSTPDLSPSTQVTASICPAAIRDCIKVIVDLPKNPKADTGLFERVFEITYDATTMKQESFKDLSINGNQMKINEIKPPKHARIIDRFLGNVGPTVSKKLGHTNTKMSWMKKLKKHALKLKNTAYKKSTLIPEPISNATTPTGSDVLINDENDVPESLES